MFNSPQEPSLTPVPSTFGSDDHKSDSLQMQKIQDSKRPAKRKRRDKMKDISLSGWLIFPREGKYGSRWKISPLSTSSAGQLQQCQTTPAPSQARPGAMFKGISWAVWSRKAVLCFIPHYCIPLLLLNSLFIEAKCVNRCTQQCSKLCIAPHYVRLKRCIKLYFQATYMK